MRYVVKLGGAGLETPVLLEGCTRAIAELVRDGNQVAVVHGGGVQLTRMLEALGKKSFVAIVQQISGSDIGRIPFCGCNQPGFVGSQLAKKN